MGYSVIIPSYNRPEMLKRALASVYAQTILPDCIHLVVDEVEDWEKYGFLHDYDSKLQVTYTGGGLGGANARNVGLEKVDADYVFFLDDDDEWRPRKIEKQIESLQQRPDCVGVTCWRSVIYESIGRRQLVTVSEKRLNSYMMIRNLTGSFSFFGYRFNAETKHVRLESGLPCAQDLEFYMALSRYGSFCVVDEDLVKYYAHEGVRITGSLERELNAFTRIAEKYSDHVSSRDRHWLLGVVNVYYAATAKAFLPYLKNLVIGSLRLLLSMRSLRSVYYMLRKCLNRPVVMRLLGKS